MHRIVSLLLASAALVSTGCLNRTIIRIDDHPDKNASIMETIDSVPYIMRTHQFWVCKEEPSALVCAKTCDGSNDLACHSISLLGSDNLR